MIRHTPTTREIIQYLVPKYAQGASVDIGAGTVKYNSIIRQHVKSYLATDAYQYPGIDAVQDACKLTYADNTFDTAFSFQTLEHVNDHDAMVSELHRVLKVKGHVILTVPFLLASHGLPHDYWRFTTRGLQTLFEQHDFTVVECGAYGGLYAVLAEFVKMLFIHPGETHPTPTQWEGREYNPFRRKFFQGIMKVLYWLDRKGFGNNDHFYASVFIVARK